MIKYFLLLPLICFLDNSVDLSKEPSFDSYRLIQWKDLSKIDFEYKYNSEFGQKVPYPIFHKDVKALDGKKVRISGYALSLDETSENQVIVLSAFPFSACFFCGGAGPESVMDIKPKSKMDRLPMDEKVTIKGTLKLNPDDLYELFYILHDAEIEK